MVGNQTYTSRPQLLSLQKKKKQNTVITFTHHIFKDKCQKNMIFTSSFCGIPKNFLILGSHFPGTTATATASVIKLLLES